MKFDGLTRTNELLKKLNNRRRCYHSKLNNIHFVYKNIFQYYQTRQWETNPKSNSWFVFSFSLLFVISRYCLHFVWQVFVRMKPFSLIDIPVSVQIKKRCVLCVCFWFWLSDVSAFMSFDFWWHRIMCCVLCEIDGDCCMDIKLLLWLFKWRTCEQIVPGNQMCEFEQQILVSIKIPSWHVPHSHPTFHHHRLSLWTFTMSYKTKFLFQSKPAFTLFHFFWEQLNKSAWTQINEPILL